MPHAEQYQKAFIREFGELLVKYGEPHNESLGIHHMELSEDGEYVQVWWNDTDKTTVCVACDSLGAMVFDIMRRILYTGWNSFLYRAGVWKNQNGIPN